jgi:transcriptional regulator GlxA family with amidase domain
LLDAIGPVELFSAATELIDVDFIGPRRGLVRSSQGLEVSVSCSYEEARDPDLILVPGGAGTRQLVNDGEFLRWLAGYARSASIVTSVCTGSAVLAAAGLLEGYRATSNKLAYGWATAQGHKVDCVPEARWVEDRDRWTSSGVAAGMDMTAALMRRLFGDERAAAAAAHIELEIHVDSSWDPFARLNGLV